MDYKLDFISRVLQRTAGKRIEHYVISRIWHLLKNNEIKMIPQQYISRMQARYALTDLYFPQIKLHVEINEPAHYFNEIIIRQDLERKMEIERRTSHKLFIIDCRQEISNIHAQVDELISIITSDVNIQISNGVFKPWKPEDDHNPNHWKAKGSIAVADEVSFNTIEDICTLFSADYRKIVRGFLRKGGIINPRANDQLIWWPSENSRNGWINSFDPIRETITETHNIPHKAIEHYNDYLHQNCTRIVFLHFKDILGFTNYKYIGVFKNDNVLSAPDVGTVWKIAGDKFDLNTCKFEVRLD